MKKIICLICLFSSVGQANLVERLTDEVNEQAALVQEQLATNLETVIPMRDSEAWYFNSFKMRIRTTAKFNIAVFGLAVRPHIELTWQRKNPSGWENYRN